MPADSSLAGREAIQWEDLAGLPLFCSEQSWRADIPRWCGEGMESLRLEGSFRLAYNGSVFVREGLGYLLTFEHLVDTGPGSRPCFPPSFPVSGNPHISYLEKAAGAYPHCPAVYPGSAVPV